MAVRWESEHDAIRRGDRVKLTERMIVARTKKAYLQRRTRTDWRNRTGTVERITTTASVMIRWDGNKSLDEWPASAVEKTAALATT